jgi:predicted transcriptional regulator
MRTSRYSERASILEVIWDQGTPTSRDIATAIYEKVSDSKTASVQKLLERLETKGCVSRDRRERAHRFGAIASRENFLWHRLESKLHRNAVERTMKERPLPEGCALHVDEADGLVAMAEFALAKARSTVHKPRSWKSGRIMPATSLSRGGQSWL